ncbi:unnamed protein product [Prorocentrum cordatum]|uniref:Galectin n=1 Tax=Prorocentrum cordatum TaxID=2364126 RepID=A0ABN9RMI0_9DINO|nr:unnamed protein product [Polarella glacialis]
MMDEFEKSLTLQVLVGKLSLSDARYRKLEHKWQPGVFINVNGDGSASLAGEGDWNAQWKFVPTDSSLFRIFKSWRADHHLNIGDDLKVSISNSGGWSGQWRYCDIADGSRFENRWKEGFYLNMKADMTLEVQNKFSDGDWSSEWLLILPTSQIIYYKPENKWTSGVYTIVNEDDTIFPISNNGSNAQLLVVSNGNDQSWFKIVNRWQADHYLNVSYDLKVLIFSKPQGQIQGTGVASGKGMTLGTLPDSRIAGSRVSV